VTESSSEAVRDAARRIEHWLLTSPLQIPTGLHAGGIAGWLDGRSRPVFVYLEITGYYLTSTAWLITGGARNPDSVAIARRRGELALGWLRRVLHAGALPRTRSYLTEGNEQDWRNDAVFTFDLAMAIRGVSAFSEVTEPDDGTGAEVHGALERGLEEIRHGQLLLPSHRTIHDETLPRRWSTRPGPHHLKAAACLLPLPLDHGLRTAASRTWTYWAEQLDTGWPVHEVHSLLYGLEGMVMNGEEPLDRAEAVFERLMQAQDGAGWLPDHLSGATVQRSDVLSQALRLGALLRASGRLRGPVWAGRLDLLVARLLEHVRPDGSVAFSHGQDIANVWCAMFAHQALVLHEASDDPTAALVRRYLV
jgi:hypothetical protein